MLYQEKEFIALLSKMLKFNPDIDVDTICDAVDCSLCPFDSLTPPDRDGCVEECQGAMIHKLEQLKKGEING